MADVRWEAINAEIQRAMAARNGGSMVDSPVTEDERRVVDQFLDASATGGGDGS